MSADLHAEAGAARIHEQGYRRYDGVRLGPNNAVRAVFLHTLRHILGFKRPFRAKVIPAGLIALAVLPAVGFSALLLLVPDFAAEVAAEVLPGPHAFLGGTIFLIFIGTAVAGPAALCGDRLHGTLALYLASPLTRRSYLLGKGLAVLVFLSALTLLPSLIYVLGVAMSGAQAQSATSVLTDVFQVVVAGLVAGVGYASLSLAAASLTDRAGAAAGMVVGFSMVSSIVEGILVQALGLPDTAGLMNVNNALVSAVLHVHVQGREAAIAAGPALVGAAAWIAALLALVLWRYEKLQVTR